MALTSRISQMLDGVTARIHLHVKDGNGHDWYFRPGEEMPGELFRPGISIIVENPVRALYYPDFGFRTDEDLEELLAVYDTDPRLQPPPAIENGCYTTIVDRIVQANFQFEVLCENPPIVFFGGRRIGLTKEQWSALKELEDANYRSKYPRG